MLGILFGTFCLIALVRVAFGRRWHGHYRRGRYGHGRYVLRWIFRRLNTGPGQEKVVLGEMEALRVTTSELRAELRKSRQDVAAIMRDDQFDRAKVDGLFRKQDELIAKLRDAAAASFEKVHGVLDGKQKADLADMLERGWGRAC